MHQRIKDDLLQFLLPVATRRIEGSETASALSDCTFDLARELIRISQGICKVTAFQLEAEHDEVRVIDSMAGLLAGVRQTYL